MTTWTSDPSLFEVFWVPFLLTLYHRGWSRRTDLDTTMARLWEQWKDKHLPSRLRATLERYQARHRQLMRENGKLRLELHKREDRFHV